MYSTIFTELPSCRLRLISRTVIFFCSSQSYRRTRSPFAVCQTDHAAAVHENHACAKEADTGRNACRHTRNVNRNTGCSHDRQKTIRGDQRHQCRTERNHHVYANRRLSCVSAAPQRSAAPDRSFEYFPAYASPLPNKNYRSNDRYRVPWKVSLPVSPSASMPYSEPETWNSIRSPLST